MRDGDEEDMKPRDEGFHLDMAQESDDSFFGGDIATARRRMRRRSR
jgi:hypothetical protein